jgi:hypothetical protein
MNRPDFVFMNGFFINQDGFFSQFVVWARAGVSVEEIEMFAIDLNSALVCAQTEYGF